jgi:predicted negative regulator of RcsB-dependent stress response
LRDNGKEIMAKKRVSRKELLKGPDEFLTFSARAIIFVKEHSRQFEYCGMAIAAIILIYLGISTYLKYINKKGQDAYNIAYYNVVKNIDPDADQKKLQESGELFNRVIEKYGRSKVSKLALPEAAFINFREKKYDEAIVRYQKFLDKVSDSDEASYQSLAKMALASCYEEKGDFKMALGFLEQLTTSSDIFLREQAMLSLARVYRLSQKLEKSREILKEFVEQFQTSPFLPIAKAHLNKLP